ncbi:acyl-coenzyme A thioesterase 1-like [Plectropomus leopardus]|uniref:acyl-coenzyme A thioesterase 1-like n=1 Tax=Plectropomus leopardus TaxID=160734 RepID=UPI001C4A95AB|nr:acyl-coenzyme A thioesterase 1-like [Plectropomus leopardus]
MWGGGGGLVEYRAALLASRGYVSMALEYIRPTELESLGMNYFETAFNIIRDHPQVHPDRVGIFGLSLGSIVTVALAAESSIIEPRCCVCVSGNHLYPRGKTLKELHHAMFIRDAHKLRVDENNCEIWRYMGLPVNADLSQTVDVSTFCTNNKFY